MRLLVFIPPDVLDLQAEFTHRCFYCGCWSWFIDSLSLLCFQELRFDVWLGLVSMAVWTHQSGVWTPPPGLLAAARCRYDLWPTCSPSHLTPHTSHITPNPSHLQVVGFTFILQANRLIFAQITNPCRPSCRRNDLHVIQTELKWSTSRPWSSRTFLYCSPVVWTLERSVITSLMTTDCETLNELYAACCRMQPPYMFETRSRLLPLFIRSVNFTLLEFILCYNYLSGTSHRFSLLPLSNCVSTKRVQIWNIFVLWNYQMKISFVLKVDTFLVVASPADFSEFPLSHLTYSSRVFVMFGVEERAEVESRFLQTQTF